MVDGIKAETAKIDGKPAIHIKPTNVPEGNLGGAGKIVQVESKKEAKEITEAINKGELDPSQVQVATLKETEGKKLDTGV